MFGKKQRTPGEQVEDLLNMIAKKEKELRTVKETDPVLKKYREEFEKARLEEAKENKNQDEFIRFYEDKKKYADDKDQSKSAVALRKYREEYKKVTKIEEEISKLKEDLTTLRKENPAANLTKLKIDLLAQIAATEKRYESYHGYLGMHMMGSYPDLMDVYKEKIEKAERKLALLKNQIAEIEKTDPKAKKGVPKSLEKKLIEAEKKSAKNIADYKYVNEEREFTYAQAHFGYTREYFNLMKQENRDMRTGKMREKEPAGAKASPVTESVAQTVTPTKQPEVQSTPVAQSKAQPAVQTKTPLNIQSKEPSKEVKPSWMDIDKVYQKPKFLTGMLGNFNEATFKNELQNLNKQGLINNYELIDNGFKLTTSTKNEITFNTKENKIYSKNLSQENFDIAARTTLAIGAKGFDMKELVAAAKQDPNNNEYLYRAYASGRKLEGFVFTNLSEDLKSQLEKKFIDEQGQQTTHTFGSQH